MWQVMWQVRMMQELQRHELVLFYMFIEEEFCTYDWNNLTNSVKQKSQRWISRK
jgi:hypothetical protein